MIDELTRYAFERWSGWFGGEPAPRLRGAAMAGGPAHRGRGFALLFAGDEPEPRVVLKIAFAQDEREWVSIEHEALTGVRAAMPGWLRNTVPAPLDLRVGDDAVVLALGTVPGRRLLVPEIAGRGSRAARRFVGSYLERSFAWSRELAVTTSRGREGDEQELAEVAHKFAASLAESESEAVAVRSFARAVGRSRIRWTAAWQHGDVSVGNVLVDRGRLRLLDWEHGSGAAEPWFDVAYSPGAMALLAERQSRELSLRAAALGALAPDGWSGRIHKRRMTEAWDHPLPMGWAVVLNLMRSSLRRRRPSNEIDLRARLAIHLLCDREFRERVGWLAAEW